MLRYQPGEQIQDGVTVYLILDTWHNSIEDMWYSEHHRDDVLAAMNKSASAVHYMPTSLRDGTFITYIAYAYCDHHIVRAMIDNDRRDADIMRHFSAPPIAGENWLMTVRAGVGMSHDEMRAAFGWLP